MKWTTQTCDIDYGGIKAGQVVNHFNNNHHLTSKYGITRRLKTLIIHYGIDIDKFYPRCFDLGDQTDFENFVENFKFSFAESVAKRFLVDKERYKGLELKIRAIYQIIKRRLISMT
jgi:tubulin monoglycylase TTLL3/8